MISNFQIFGDDTANKTAIVVNIDSGEKVTGIIFDKIGVTWYGKAYDLKGVWHSVIRDNYLMTSSGITLRGRNIKISIEENKLVAKQELISDYSLNGIEVLQEGQYRSEDIRISSNLIFGYDYGIDIETILFCNIVDNDIDYCLKKGINILLVESVLNIKNNWIAMDENTISTNPFFAIDLQPLGNLNNSTKNIEGNTVHGSHFGGYAFKIGFNQNNINISGNEIDNYGGIATDNSYTRINSNKIESIEYAIVLGYCTDVEIGLNNIVSGDIFSLGGQKGINISQNNAGSLMLGFNEIIKLPSNQTTTTGTLSSIGKGLFNNVNNHFLAIGSANSFNNSFNFGNVKFSISNDNYTLMVDNANNTDTDFLCNLKIIQGS
jgi:hypothetical protein